MSYTDRLDVMSHHFQSVLTEDHVGHLDWFWPWIQAVPTPTAASWWCSEDCSSFITCQRSKLVSWCSGPSALFVLQVGGSRHPDLLPSRPPRHHRRFLPSHLGGHGGLLRYSEMQPAAAVLGKSTKTESSSDPNPQPRSRSFPQKLKTFSQVFKVTSFLRNLQTLLLWFLKRWGVYLRVMQKWVWIVHTKASEHRDDGRQKQTVAQDQTLVLQHWTQSLCWRSLGWKPHLSPADYCLLIPRMGNVLVTVAYMVNVNQSD